MESETEKSSFCNCILAIRNSVLYNKKKQTILESPAQRIYHVKHHVIGMHCTWPISRMTFLFLRFSLPSAAQPWIHLVGGYTHVTNDMQQSAAKIVGSFMEEVLP